MKESPFLTHREILLNGYGAAIWLRRLTLSLWNGRSWPADMSGVAGLDGKHFAIAIELVAWYREHGENDPDFMDTGRACEAMAIEGKRQAEQRKAYDDWEQLAQQALVRLGPQSRIVAFDNYEWFFDKFTKGLSPVQAAEQAIAEGVGLE